MHKIKSLFTASLCLFGLSCYLFAANGPSEIMGGGNIRNANSSSGRVIDIDKLNALRDNYRSRMIRIGVNGYWNNKTGTVIGLDDMDEAYDLAVARGRNVLGSFVWKPGGAVPIGNYQKWYDIGRTYAARYPRVTHWAAFNEPDAWKSDLRNYPTMAAYRNALEGLADGVRSVRASTAVSPAGIRANLNNVFTGSGFIPAISRLVNDATLGGIDLHIYKTDDNGLFNGQIPNRYNRSAQRLFEMHKNQSSITRDCDFYCTETGIRQLNANNQNVSNPNAVQEKALAKRYFTMLWDTVGVTRDNGRTSASQIAFGWSLFGDAEPRYNMVSDLTPFTPKSRAVAYMNLSRWTIGTDWVNLDPEGAGVFVLENPGVRKVYVKQNVPGWTNDLSSRFMVGNIPSGYTKLRVFNWEGRVRTIDINGRRNVRVSGLNRDETYVFIAQVN